GTAMGGGSSGNGTVFKVNADGTDFAPLYNLVGTDGTGPQSKLVLSESTLYGTAYSGGSSGNGTVFAVNIDGTEFRTLHQFSATSGLTLTNSDGALLQAGLVLGGNTLYGAAYKGGLYGRGALFAVNTDGSGFTILHTFPALATNSVGVRTNSDGAHP